MSNEHIPVGQSDEAGMPRYAGIATFALLPHIESVPHADIAVLGIPFDGGTSFRPGARFGPSHIREASRQLHPYHQTHDVHPFAVHQVVDAGDLGVSPYSIASAVSTIERAANEFGEQGTRLVALGGDHTIALPLLRAVAKQHGPVAVIHFDAHLDTWDTLHRAPIWHGSPFRRAAEEGILDQSRCLHVGLRGGVYDRVELEDDKVLGFQVIRADDYQEHGVKVIIDRIRARVAGGPVYLSIDIDVLDPAHAPATGTPEVAGLTTRELFATIRGLTGIGIIGADIVEVAPAYDHAQLTGLAAAHTVWEVLSVMAFDAKHGIED
ncbi:agmatinase [Agromyces endophyticus]|uniref:agmatinase n=1 Tax=Agromyces sp. H17E-10 TaxID=2932244 RepID=UPI001FD0CFC8|nr:agmatinase [Agromyces sp. H17E-10]UOQ89192.1 agmatinase [Agromyces sp. H17E-10]